LVALAATLAWGSYHLGATRRRVEAAPKLKVALVQGNIDQSVKNARQANAGFIIDRYVPLTLEADRRGVDLVAWPEATYPYGLPAAIDSFARLPGMEQLEHAHLLAGAGTWDPLPGGGGGGGGRREGIASNSVFLVDPSLEVLGRYAKHHLVPFGEYVPSWLPFVREIVPVVGRQVPGGDLTVLSFQAPGGAPGDRVSLAPMICFDAIFPEVNVAFARRDPEPEILVNPTNDAWYGYSSAPHQFLTIVQLRAIEAGKAVARPAWAGISALILPTGEVLDALGIGPVDPERAPDPDEQARLLVGSLPRLRGLTPYTRFGDLFAWTATVAALVLLAAALRRGSRR
jgi:apolipoprotein N-acyltransferase